MFSLRIISPIVFNATRPFTGANIYLFFMHYLIDNFISSFKDYNSF